MNRKSTPCHIDMRSELVLLPILPEEKDDKCKAECNVEPLMFLAAIPMYEARHNLLLCFVSLKYSETTCITRDFPIPPCPAMISWSADQQTF